MKMRKKFNKVTFFAVYFFFALIFIGSTQVAGKPTTLPQWTLAIYMDSDNNLDDWAQKDINKLMAVGSTLNVNVVVFWDKLNGPDKAYKVEKDKLVELTNFTIPNGPEPNMGDPVTLKAWVGYTTTEFPSKKYALLLWDHGDDYRGAMYDYTLPAGTPLPSFGYDLLTNQEIVSALTGYKIDVMLYSACVMQMIEVCYEYLLGGLNITYLVSNEAYDPMDGFPYNTILKNLEDSKYNDPLEFSKMWVHEYIYYYKYVGNARSQAVTLSVVEIGKVEQVVTNIKDMTVALMLDMKGSKSIVGPARAHANLPWSENGWERDIDLPTFVAMIHDKSLDPQIVSSSQRLTDSLTGPNGAILYCESLKGKSGYLGMGIFFPESHGAYENNFHLYGNLYPQMKFATDGNWLNFLNAYWDTTTK